MPRKLGRKNKHRQSTLANLAKALFKNEKIETTEPKAKEAGRYAEKLITKAKKGTQHARRQVMGELQDEEAIEILFDDLATRYADRPGGYTRVLKLGPRRGDGAPMALLELVE